MIDQVMGASLLGARHSVAHLLYRHHMSATEWRAPSNESASSPPRRVALHAARVGGGLAPWILAAGRRQPAFRPVVVHLDLMAALTQILDRFRRNAAFQHQHARPGGAWPEGGGEVLAVPGRRVDRFLQVHAAMDVAQEHLGDPLLLLVAAGRPPDHVRLAVAVRERRRQRSAPPLAATAAREPSALRSWTTPP